MKYRVLRAERNDECAFETATSLVTNPCVTFVIDFRSRHTLNKLACYVIDIIFRHIRIPFNETFANQNIFQTPNKAKSYFLT